MFKKRDISKLLEIDKYIPQTVVYIKPYFEKKVLPAPIHCGTAGSYDEKGLYIPKRFFHKPRKKLKPNPGCVVTPMRKSMITGRRYVDKLGVICGDAHARLMATDPERVKQVETLHIAGKNIPDKMRKGLRKFRKLMRKTGGTLVNKNYMKEYSEDYMRINGVIMIKKVLAPCRKSFKPETGVVIGALDA